MAVFSQVETAAAPPALGPYSQAVKSGSLLFLSGQVGVNPGTGKLVSGGVVAEARQAFENIGAVLRAANIDFSHVVKVAVFLVSMQEFSSLNQVYQEFFSPPFPARSAVAVRELPAGAVVEIEVTAVL